MSFRSAALSWLPGSLLFVGNIYAGSRALSRIVRHPPPAANIVDLTPLVINPNYPLSGHPVVLHFAELLPRCEQPDLEGLPPWGVCSPATVSQVTYYTLIIVLSRLQKLQQLNFIRSVDGGSQSPAVCQTLELKDKIIVRVWLHSLCLMLLAAVNLPLSDPQVTVCPTYHTVVCLSKCSQSFYSLSAVQCQRLPVGCSSSQLCRFVFWMHRNTCQPLCWVYLQGAFSFFLGVYRVFKSHYKPSGLRWVSSHTVWITMQL